MIKNTFQVDIWPVPGGACSPAPQKLGPSALVWEIAQYLSQIRA